MTYRILKKTRYKQPDVYYIQKRVLWVWFYLWINDGYQHSSLLKFDSIEDAEHYINTKSEYYIYLQKTYNSLTEVKRIRL